MAAALPLENDPRVREALTYFLDFEWLNRNLYFGLFERTTSYFQGSVLASTGIRELRRKPVFHSPNVFPPESFEPRDVHEADPPASTVLPSGSVFRFPESKQCRYCFGLWRSCRHTETAAAAVRLKVLAVDC